jgi:GT2 family glycosyltransferase
MMSSLVRAAADGHPVVAVVLASANRAELLGHVIGDILTQTRPPQHLVLSVPDRSSLPAQGVPAAAIVVHASGLAAQRNAGLAAVQDADLVFFFDDDAVVRADYLQRAVDVFTSRPEVVGLTGRVLLDGAAGREIGRAEAVDALRRSEECAPTGTTQPSRTLYGCNFAYRASVARDVLLDDRLPLYSWLEDHDFARRLMRVGTLVKAHDCVIVHQGAKSGGRQAHLRLGYSQVMNPAYFVGKGSFPVWLAAWEIFRPTAKNVVFSVIGSQRSWRRKRLDGNLLAARDVVGGRLTPERILGLR